tara:strand:- start:2007 stop:2765 length:759 start_codon:yes stop_codon:yes gene_type:complete
MANKKISSLGSLGGTPDVADIIPITDVSDTTGSAQGTTKKVTVANLVAAAPQGDLVASNNLSDVASAGTARTNLGLGTAASQDVGTSASNVVQLDGTAKLPAVDGSQLTNVDVDTPLNTALRGSDSSHIGANPEQTFKITDNPYSTIAIVADEDGNLTYALKDASAEVRVVKGTSGTPLRFALSNELPAFILSNDTGEPDIEIEDPDGEKISIISGDSDTKGVNGLPIIQGYNPKTIGANPSPLLISGGTIS